jgi:hypothetical protein
MNTLIKKILLACLIFTLTNAYTFAGVTTPTCTSDSFLTNTAYEAPPPSPSTTNTEFNFLPHSLLSSLYSYVTHLFTDDTCKQVNKT